jgi:hypothetical protein
MCTVQGKNGVFRDSAHKGLQLLQENHINTHTHIHFIPSTQQFSTSIVVELHAAIAVCSSTTMNTSNIQFTSVFKDEI